MRGRDGGRGDAGRDIGVWSVAINGNLSSTGCWDYERSRHAGGWGFRTRPPGLVPERVWGEPLGLVAWMGQPSSCLLACAGVETAGRRAPLVEDAWVVLRAAGPG